MESMHTNVMLNNSHNHEFLSWKNWLRIFWQKNARSRFQLKEFWRWIFLASNWGLYAFVFLICSGLIKPKKIMEAVFGK